jgi:glycosyltransferase involved in cell wall biosynthesis
MVSPALIGARTHMQISHRNDGVAVMLSTAAMKRGGVTRAVLNRARLYAEAGIPVRVVLTWFSYHEDLEEAEIRRAWQLPDIVEFRYFWREAAPGSGGAPADPSAGARDEPGLSAFSSGPGGQTVQFYEDGVLVKTKRFDNGGNIQTITRHDAARRIVSRDQFDPAGQLVCTDEMDPSTGRATLRRWFDGSGKCWLTCWLAPSGHPRGTVQHHPTPAAYDRFGQRVAEWVDHVTSDWARPVVMADLRRHDSVLLNLEHPGAKTVAVLHNCHTQPPYRTSDPTEVSYISLIGHIDSFDAVVVLTGKQRDDVVERAHGGNLTVINHGITPVSPIDTPRESGLLVAIARLDGQKRLDHAIRAFALAAPQVPGARFHIYGKGSDEKKLRELVRELAMTDHIEFKGFTSKPLEVFATATATVLSSLYEGLPLVLNEAMSVGTPFVAYDVNYGPAEVIRHEEDGLLVPPDDIDALAAALVRVLGDPSYAAKLGERAREVAERFSPERWSAEWLGLHYQLAGTTAESRSTAPATASGA